MNDVLNLLTDINLDDLVASFGWTDRPALARGLRAAFRRSARKFARQILTFDLQVGKEGLPQAARLALRGYVRGVRVIGRDRVPSGPVLFLSNHPGMTDTLALFAAIHRPDLNIIALERPFLKCLPNVTSRLFYVSDRPEQRLQAVRQAARHLKAGGAVLTFPAGRIEPDPAVYPGAEESLADWTDSAGVFLRLAPETRIVPVLVSGVLWRPAVTHPLTRLKRERAEREKLGAALQLLAQVVFDLRPVQVTVQFGTPIAADKTHDLAALHASVLKGMCTLLRAPMAEAGEELPL